MEEVSWSISDCEGGVVAEGNAPFDGCLVNYHLMQQLACLIHMAMVGMVMF